MSKVSKSTRFDLTAELAQSAAIAKHIAKLLTKTNIVGSIERGERNVSIDNLERIARALNLEPWQLIRQPDGDR